jgi:hypothetical protein
MLGLARLPKEREIDAPDVAHAAILSMTACNDIELMAKQN